MKMDFNGPPLMSGANFVTSSFNLHYEVAKLYMEIGSNVIAVEHLEKVLKVKPDFEDAKVLIKELSL